MSKITKLTKELGHKTGNPFFRPTVFFFFTTENRDCYFEFKVALRIADHSENREKS